MATLIVKEKINNSGEPIAYGKEISIDMSKIEGTSTKSLYVRTGFMNGTKFLSQRGNGGSGAGDICRISEDAEIEVNQSLFNRLNVFAQKASAIV